MSAKRALLSAVAVGLVIQSLPSVAAELEEIIVSARKRQESILKVPVVENVVTQETLQTYQIQDLTDLSSKVPGLQMGEAVLAIGPQISIRGVGTSALDAGVDQSVSLNIDGLSMTQGLAYSAGLFDLQQVEVLKGPQALFFGKNSPGGVIAMRTADPGDKGEAIARVGYEFEAREEHAELILSAPVTSTLGVRLAGSFSNTDGFFYNRATAAPGTGATDPDPKRITQSKDYIVRGTLLWKPTDVFDARVKLNWTSSSADGDAGLEQLTSCPDGKGPDPVLHIPFINPNDDCTLDRNFYVVHMDPAKFPGIRNNGRPFSDLTQKFGTVELNYRPSTDVTLTSVTGYYTAQDDSLINGVMSGFAGPSLTADNMFNRRDFTQELRADTQFTGPLNFTGGAFFQDGQIFNNVTVGGNTAYLLPAILTAGSHRVDIQSVSVFGQGRWKPVETIELAGGVRWTHEQRGDTAKFRNPVSGVYGVVPDPGISAKNYSPEISLTYTPTDELTLFGNVKQGYKSGSYQITTPLAPGAKNSFGDEKVDGGELGLKSRLLNRTLSLNVAGYYYVYKGLQVGANDAATGQIPVIRVINAGEAKTYGVDLDLTYRAPFLEGLSANAAVNWNHARYTDLKGVACYGGQMISEGCNAGFDGTYYNTQVLDGLQLVRAPAWQVNLGANYEHRFGEALKMSFGADGQYSDEYPTTLSFRKDTWQKAYTLFGAHITASDPDDVWEVAFIGNNLGNKITTGSCTMFNGQDGQILVGNKAVQQPTGSNSRGTAGIDEVVCTPRRGREMWIRLTFKAFGSPK